MHARALLLAAACLAACGEREVPAAPVVGCERGGSGTLPAAAREAGVIAGPLLFAYGMELAGHPEIVRPQAEMLRELSRSASATEGERARAEETLRHTPRDGYGVAELMVVLEAGQRATVALPGNEQERAAFVYTSRAVETERAGAAGIHRIAEGDAAVTFEACEVGPTNWLGGLVVAGPPRCLPVHVWVDDAEEPLLTHLPIATGDRPCRLDTRATRPSVDSD
ncbi:MAG TPA: hypothetical protein VGW10_02560 [Solirubrobacteraceae bacterium]|nr:hypothetical protein [Solirubrobacteraceae bacterium]